MRANSIHDRKGNNYRYQRAVKDVIDKEERKRLEEKWDDIYRDGDESFADFEDD